MPLTSCQLSACRITLQGRGKSAGRGGVGSGREGLRRVALNLPPARHKWVMSRVWGGVLRRWRVVGGRNRSGLLSTRSAAVKDRGDGRKGGDGSVKGAVRRQDSLGCAAANSNGV